MAISSFGIITFADVAAQTVQDKPIYEKFALVVRSALVWRGASTTRMERITMICDRPLIGLGYAGGVGWQEVGFEDVAGGTEQERKVTESGQHKESTSDAPKPCWMPSLGVESTRGARLSYSLHTTTTSNTCCSPIDLLPLHSMSPLQNILHLDQSNTRPASPEPRQHRIRLGKHRVYLTNRRASPIVVNTCSLCAPFHCSLCYRRTKALYLQ